MDMPVICAEEINSQGALALNAIQEHSEKKRASLLFSDFDANAFLLVKYKRPPLFIEGPQRRLITLPFPDRSASNISICLILPDFNKSRKAATDPDVDRQARQWEAKLGDRFGLVAGKDYAKIFTFNQMKREYSQIEDREKLANAYDLFMVDRMILAKVMYFMNKYFRRPTKMPIPINANQNFSRALKNAPSLTQLVTPPMKDSFSIRFGNLNQPLAHLEANLRAVVDVMVPHCAGGPINIRSCYIQALQISLPVFVDFGSANEVQLKEPEQRQYSVEVDEVSTLPDGLAVEVRADGQVRVVDKESGLEVLYPTEQDEWEETDDLKPMSKRNVEQILRKKSAKQKKVELGTAEEGIKEEGGNGAGEGTKKRRKRKKKANQDKEEEEDKEKDEEKRAKEGEERGLGKARKRKVSKMEPEEEEEMEKMEKKTEEDDGVVAKSARKLKKRKRTK